MQDSQPPTCNLWHILIPCIRKQKQQEDKGQDYRDQIKFDIWIPFFIFSKIIWILKYMSTIQIKTNKYIFLTNDLHNYRNLISQNLNDSNSLKHEKMKYLSVLNFKGFIPPKNILSRIFCQIWKIFWIYTWLKIFNIEYASHLIFPSYCPQKIFITFFSINISN